MDFGFGGNMNISYTPGAPARRNSLAVWQAVAAAAAASSVWQFGVWQLIGIAVMLYLKLMLPRLSLQIPRSNTHISDGGMSSCNTRRNKWTKCKKYFQSIEETRILEALIYQLKLIVLTINVSDFIRDSVVVFFLLFFLIVSISLIPSRACIGRRKGMLEFGGSKFWSLVYIYCFSNKQKF